jgi:hypothetical protein
MCACMSVHVSTQGLKGCMPQHARKNNPRSSSSSSSSSQASDRLVCAACLCVCDRCVCTLCRQVCVPARQLLPLPADRHGVQLGRPTDLCWQLRVFRGACMHLCWGAAEAPAPCAVPLLSSSAVVCGPKTTAVCIGVRFCWGTAEAPAPCCSAPTEQLSSL